MTRPRTYALLGFLLGWGAPAGAVLVQVLRKYNHDIYLWVSREISTHPWLYAYMTVSTVTVFTIFGYWLGRRLAGLERRTYLLQDASESLNRQSMTDGLTGLFNHRYIQERLGLELERATRYQTPLSILMVDIDDFKKVNDDHGHMVGDEALKHVTHRLKEAVRKVDIVGRYGGEEFLVILPQTSQQTATEVAERIVADLRANPLQIEGKPPLTVTVTAGLASGPQAEQSSRNALIKAADEALYRGKRQGKNRVVLS
jgi:diguanylate cyclase (GGDEF)-like protein